MVLPIVDDLGDCPPGDQSIGCVEYGIHAVGIRYFQLLAKWKSCSVDGAWWRVGVKEQRTRIDAAQLRFILSYRVWKGFPTNFHGTHPIP
jgi:hypothetical protein